MGAAEAVAFATGRDLLNDNLKHNGRVWYLGLENPLKEYERRLAAVVLHHRNDPTHVRKGQPGQELTADDARGASALVNSARSVRMLSSMSQDAAEKPTYR